MKSWEESFELLNVIGIAIKIGMVMMIKYKAKGMICVKLTKLH